MNAKEFYIALTANGSMKDYDKVIPIDIALQFAELYLAQEGNIDSLVVPTPPKKKIFSASTKRDFPKRYLCLDHKLFFGKYKGSLLSEIIDLDVDYLIWCLDKFDGFFVTVKAAASIESESGRKGYKVPKERIEDEKEDLPF